MRILVLAACTLVVSAAVRAQEQEPDPPAAQPALPLTLIRHDPASRWWLSGQINVIAQSHGSFTSPYEGPNSFRHEAEHAVSRVLTLYTGVRLPNGWETIFDLESAGGRGLSDAFGLAGFTNLDVVRNPALGSAPYIARVMVRKVIALSSDRVESTPGPLSLADTLPARRIDIRAGKYGTADFFDQNGPGSDSHFQFTNWTVDNNGGYDYAADTRGYTYGVIVEYSAPRWTLRGAVALMPKVANGIHLDADITRARGDNVELELHSVPNLVVRLLGYANHANMGSYSEAIAAFRTGEDTTPDIVAHRKQRRVKYGAGANVEYTTSEGVRIFGRSGWNSGDTESFAYTEVNSTLELGSDISGARWRRLRDRLGVAFATSGLSAGHREYLRLGGFGFLLGDGNLRYGREAIVETYYTAHVWRGVYGSGGAQVITNPGYNRDRGPVFVQMLRMHLEF